MAETELHFRLERNEDRTLTCIMCGRWKCELCFVARGGKTTVTGVHEKCATKWNESYKSQMSAIDAEAARWEDASRWGSHER